MRPLAWLELFLFAAMTLVACVHLLAASGHFPAERRAPALQSWSGATLLFGSMGLVAACFVAALIIVCKSAPWYAVVIAGGSAILAAPLALRPWPDRFVNGPATLVTFAAVAAALALIMARVLEQGLSAS
jgi:hypothetical protein